MADLGEHEGELVLRADSTTAKAMSDRFGVGRARHMQTRWLWLQERVQHQELRIVHVPSHDNVADLLTKVLAGPGQDKFLARIGLLFPARA